MSKQPSAGFSHFTPLAIAVVLFILCPLSAGDDDAKAEKAIKAMGGRLERDRKAKDKPIIEVHFDGDKMTDAGMKELAGLKKLKMLSLFGPKVTDAGLKELAGLDGLLGLHFLRANVTDAGLKEIAACKN